MVWSNACEYIAFAQNPLCLVGQVRRRVLAYMSSHQKYPLDLRHTNPNDQTEYGAASKGRTKPVSCRPLTVCNMLCKSPSDRGGC